MKFKIIFLIGFCAILLGAGCTQENQDTVSFAVGGAPNEIGFWELLIRDFEKESGIKINLLRQPTDTDQRRQGLVIPLRAQKNDPDIFLMDVAWLAQFAASGWLEILDSAISQKIINKSDFFERIIDLADTYEGKLMALPVYVDGGLLYYRKDLLEKHGRSTPPQTWSELVAFSNKIQKEQRKSNPDFYGFVWQGAQYEGLICNFLEFAASNNGGIVIENGRIRMNFMENIAALNFMSELIGKYRISPPNTFTEMKEEETRSFFQQGNALFERNWPYAWALHQSEGSYVKGKVGIAALPHFDKGTNASTLGGWHIGISKYTDRKKEAFKFLKFVTSYSVQKKLALELGWNPGRKDVYSDREVLERLPHFSDLHDVFENALPRPNLPYYTQISEVLQRYISAALAGELSAEEALVKAEKEAQKIMNRYESRQ